MIDGIKTENDMGVLNEEDAAVMNTNEVRVPSTFSVQEAEPEVSCFQIVFALLFM
jgi:hypothetical protein